VRDAEASIDDLRHGDVGQVEIAYSLICTGTAKPQLR
jgi:hypothetical protein